MPYPSIPSIDSEVSDWLVRRETYVALAADHLVAVELGGKGLERGLNDTTTETEDQVEGRLL